MRAAPNGEVRIIADNVPAANGITAYQDRLFMDECRPDGRLFELFADGRAPRLLAEHLPLPNALSVGPDGNIYFPAIGANEIWRVPLAGGKPERFAGDLAVPTAVKINSKGAILSTQGRSGEILRIDLQSGARSVVATVRPGLDNLALTPDDRLFVSHFVDGGVAEILADGRERRLVAPGFLGPMDLAVATDGVIYAADGISMAAVTPDGAARRVGCCSMVISLASCAAWRRAPTGNGRTTSGGDVTTYHPVTHEMTEHARGSTNFTVSLAADGRSSSPKVAKGEFWRSTAATSRWRGADSRGRLGSPRRRRLVLCQRSGQRTCSASEWRGERSSTG